MHYPPIPEYYFPLAEHFLDICFEGRPRTLDTQRCPCYLSATQENLTLLPWSSCKGGSYLVLDVMR